MRKAVTLIEVLLVVVLSALLMTAIIPFIRSVSDTWSVGSGKTEILQNGRAALETMTRYIRQASRITRIPDSSTIKIRDRDDTFDITFYYVGAQKNLVMRSNETGSDVDSLLAPGVDSLTFNFLQDNGTPATKANQVKSVKIQMVLSDPTDSTTHTLALEDTVTLRQDVKASTPIWAIEGRLTSNNLMEIANDILVGGFNVTTNSGDCLSVNLIDGSCWVADRENRRVKKISLTGELLAELNSTFRDPVGISVNSVLLYKGRETVWVGDVGRNRVYRIYWTGSNWAIEEVGSFNNPFAVSVNPYEIEPKVGVDRRETCWVAEAGRDRVHRIYWTGSNWASDYATGFGNPRDVCVNPNENINGRNTCWVADIGDDSIKKIYWRLTPAPARYVVISLSMGRRTDPRSVSVNTADNTCWVANSGSNSSVRKISADASTILAENLNFSTPYSVSVNPTDDTCWVADYNHDQVVRLNADGDEEFRISGFIGPVAVSVSPNP